jgi:hypothetical protein
MSCGSPRSSTGWARLDSKFALRRPRAQIFLLCKAAGFDTFQPGCVVRVATLRFAELFGDFPIMPIALKLHASIMMLEQLDLIWLLYAH